MSDAPCLTDKDFAILDAMLVRRAALGDPLAAMIEDKLEAAVVVSAEEIGADVATLNSRVAFRVDSQPVEERTLVHHEGRGTVGRSLPIATRRGLAILGMKEGQTVEAERHGGGFERIVLDKVLYQPEAARRDVHAEATAPARPRLVLVHDAGSDWQPLGEPAKMRQGWTGDDDPGPSAA